MINSIMLAKSNEESFATLDIGKINLETCELTLYKSGAASTLIKYSDSVMMFNSPSNPIGIVCYAVKVPLFNLRNHDLIQKFLSVNVILTKMMFLLCCQTALTNLCMFI